MSAVGCFASVGEVCLKIPFQSGLSELCFDFSLRRLRASDLLGAEVIYISVGYIAKRFLFGIKLLFILV
jgi:hypothetical protein